MEESPGAALSRILLGNRVQQAVHVAAKFRIADLVADGPRTAPDLAAAAGLHAGALYRLLRVLAGYGIFAEDEQGRFGLTPIANLLRTGTRESKHAFAMWSGPPSYQLFGSLDHSVRTGEPAFDELFGCEFYEYLARNPEHGAIFDEFMARQSAPMGPVLAARDLPAGATVVDVGGGRGELIAAVLAAHPDARGVLYDTGRALERAPEVLARAGVADRCDIVAGDHLKSVPAGGDVYLLKSIVHGFADAEATAVLANCRKAMAPDGRVWIVEFVLPPGNTPSPGKLMDLLMLVGSHGGRERGEAEFRELCADAGLELTGVDVTRYGYGVVAARAAG
ncbi:methyltransferase [Nucisporomicrobium flavum]|uniref:methyltransferase n=1 Tax=Nucisporomicrobium flavum TaxID=2785915 RepID=UPI003C2E5A92